jgi:N-acyl-D-aspartate/D-glutamate deacylase
MQRAKRAKIEQQPYLARASAVKRRRIARRRTVPCAILPTRLATLLIVASMGCGGMTARPSQEQADVVIHGATLIDGTGQPGVVGDLAMRGETIVAVGRWQGSARQIIDGTGLVAAPGFIDLHNHSDLTPRGKSEPYTVAPDTRSIDNFISQGCTTVVTGNCGAGVVDVGAYLDSISKNGAGTNIVHLVPHGAVREKVFGSQDRPPTPSELSQMQALVAEGMQKGAWGLSTGLWYPPGAYAKTEEVIELAKVVHKHGGIYASHMRNEDTHLLAAIRETIEIGAKAGCPAHISHLKCSTRDAWGKMSEVTALIEEARAKGQKVTADQYPYDASSTSLTAYLVPRAAQEGGPKALVKRLDDPSTGPQIREAVQKNMDLHGGPARFQITSFPEAPAYLGKSIAEIAKEEGKDPLDKAIDLIRGNAGVVAFAMQEDDMFFAMKKPYVATASDGRASTLTDGHPHPRFYGSFPRKIGKFAIEQGVMPLAAAIRSATGLPADILGLKDRGLLKAGLKADVVVFDPKTFRDQATFTKPHQHSTGVKWVFVNGVAVIADGQRTGAIPGRALRRPGI